MPTSAGMTVIFGMIELVNRFFLDDLLSLAFYRETNTKLCPLALLGFNG